MAAAADGILNSSPSALALSALQRAHAAAFIDGHDALGLAITCYPMHLLPVNSTGVGGVAFSFVEAVEWMRFETEQDYHVYAGKIEAASHQVEEAIDAMREGMRRGWLQSAAVLQRVEEQVRHPKQLDIHKHECPIHMRLTVAQPPHLGAFYR